MPVVAVEVSALPQDGSTQVAWNLTISLVADVFLYRDIWRNRIKWALDSAGIDGILQDLGTARQDAKIWSYGWLAYGSQWNLQSQVEEALERLLDIFLNDHLAANPRH
jgi:hypothetical protein